MSDDIRTTVSVSSETLTLINQYAGYLNFSNKRRYTLNEALNGLLKEQLWKLRKRRAR
jgi:hypothetical protein